MNNISYREIIKSCHKTKKEDYKLYYYHRLLSLPLTKLFYKLNIQADTISIAMIILSIVSFVFMTFENTSMFWIGFFLSFMAFLFDKIDGDLARLYGTDNIKGAVYDFVYHRFSLFLFYLGIGIHFSYQNEYLPVIAATAGFISNYIEEMQLLPYRVYAHKYIIKKENINLNVSVQYNEPFYFKVLKIFRMQLFLYYYFILAFIMDIFLNNAVYIFMLIALIAMTIYSIFQIYITIKYKFDQDIFLLDRSIKGEK
jgi:phosphatidylglycerophosphate synthase